MVVWEGPKNAFDNGEYGIYLFTYMIGVSKQEVNLAVNSCKFIYNVHINCSIFLIWLMPGSIAFSFTTL